MARPKRATPKPRQAPIRLDEDLNAQAAALAERAGESKATIVRQAIRLGLKELPARLGLDQ